MRDKTIFFHSFPTPNGPMHLGHLAGPFVAGDIYVRYLQQQGKQVIRLGGIDQNQSWSGIEKENTFHYTDKIKNTLSAMLIETDFFIEPLHDHDFQKITQDVFYELFNKGVLFLKNSATFVCSATGRYLADCEVNGWIFRYGIKGNNKGGQDDPSPNDKTRYAP